MTHGPKPSAPSLGSSNLFLSALDLGQCLKAHETNPDCWRNALGQSNFLRLNLAFGGHMLDVSTAHTARVAKH